MSSEATLPPPKNARCPAALFVQMRLETADAALLLRDEDIAQAAGTALAARIRMLRCRPLAVGGSQNHLTAIIQFPASLALHDLMQVAREATAVAVARALTLEDGLPIAPDRIWSSQSSLQTLCEADLPAAMRDIRQQAVRTSASSDS